MLPPGRTREEQTFDLRHKGSASTFGEPKQEEALLTIVNREYLWIFYPAKEKERWRRFD